MDVYDLIARVRNVSTTIEKPEAVETCLTELRDTIADVLTRLAEMVEVSHKQNHSAIQDLTDSIRDLKETINDRLPKK